MLLVSLSLLKYESWPVKRVVFYVLIWTLPMESNFLFEAKERGRARRGKSALVIPGFMMSLERIRGSSAG